MDVRTGCLAAQADAEHVRCRGVVRSLWRLGNLLLASTCSRCGGRIRAMIRIPSSVVPDLVLCTRVQFRCNVELPYNPVVVNFHHRTRAPIEDRMLQFGTYCIRCAPLPTQQTGLCAGAGRGQRGRAPPAQLPLYASKP